MTALTVALLVVACASIVTVGGGGKAEASAGVVSEAAPLALMVRLPEGIAPDASDSRALVSSDGLEVTVHAWPSVEQDKSLKEGDSFALFAVDAEVALESGQLAVSVEPGAIPPEYVSASGMVDFQVQVMDRAAGWSDMSELSVLRVETEAGAAWADPTSGLDGLSRSADGAETAPTLDLSGVSGDPGECDESVGCGAGEAAAGASTMAATNCLVWGPEGEFLSSKNALAKVGSSFALR